MTSLCYVDLQPLTIADHSASAKSPVPHIWIAIADILPITTHALFMEHCHPVFNLAISIDMAASHTREHHPNYETLHGEQTCHQEYAWVVIRQLYGHEFCCSFIHH